MSTNLKTLLKHKALNEWRLLGLIALPISVAVIITMMGLDLSQAESVSSMIQFSVRCSVPWLYLAFAASSVYALFPGEASRWLLRNRKIMGLCFAAGMAWQLLFIVWLVTVHSDYFANEVYVLRDLIEGLLGYAFLIAMIITSFKAGRSLIKPKQWKLLHKSGIYFLWAYAWSVYWYELFYYTEVDAVDYAYYWFGITAWGLRVAAWTKKRWQFTDKKPAAGALLWLGIATIAIGVFGVCFGSLWSEQAEALVTGYRVTYFFEMYFPYYPFVPFFPAFVIALGAYLLIKPRG
ncbi:MAG: hypothetical protein V7746_17005 [Halioglobus sp.]